jgi:hypothetical protein
MKWNDVKLDYVKLNQQSSVNSVKLIETELLNDVKVT